MIPHAEGNALGLWRWAWRVGVQVILIAAALFIFSSMTDRHDKLIVAILGELYITIRVLGIANTRMFLALFEFTQIKFQHLYRRLDLPDSSDEEWVEARRKFSDLKASAVPIEIGLTIIGLICLYEIFLNISS